MDIPMPDVRMLGEHSIHICLLSYLINLQLTRTDNFLISYLLRLLSIPQYGEFDCWNLECPPLTCDKPLPLTPGDCCPRCEDDPCNLLVGSSKNDSTIGKPCTYKGHQFESGKTFSDTSSHCTTCACQVIVSFEFATFSTS